MMKPIPPDTPMREEQPVRTSTTMQCKNNAIVLKLQAFQTFFAETTGLQPYQ